MRTQRIGGGLVVCALFSAIYGIADAQTTKGNAGVDTSVGMQRQVNLTPQEQLAQADAFRASAADFAQKLGTILGDWTDITRKPVAQQRQLLRKLVPDRLTVTPHVDAKRK